MHGLPDDIASPAFNPKKEASLWVLNSQIANIESILSFAKEQAKKFEAENDELRFAQWNLRAGEAFSQLAILRARLS